MWRSNCQHAGTQVAFHIGRKLIGDRTAKPHLSRCVVTELQFADAAAIYARITSDMEVAGFSLVSFASQFCLMVSFTKTKGMLVKAELLSSGFIQLHQGNVDLVDDFTHLGTSLSANGRINREKSARLAKASQSFGALWASVFGNNHLSTSTKVHVYSAVV